jgi:putative ABC transport system permease protein
MTILARAEGEPSALAATLRSEVRSIDSGLPVYAVGPLTDRLSEAVAQPRFNFTLILIFAAAAVLLAAVGLYGVLAQSVAERAHEIGIRLAIGASPLDVVRQVAGQGAALVLAGGVIGLAAGVFVSRLVAGLLYGVSPLDPLTYALVCGVLLVVAGAATYLPVRRASKVDPIVALRYE